MRTVPVTPPPPLHPLRMSAARRESQERQGRRRIFPRPMVAVRARPRGYGQQAPLGSRRRTGQQHTAFYGGTKPTLLGGEITGCCYKSVWGQWLVDVALGDRDLRYSNVAALNRRSRGTATICCVVSGPAESCALSIVKGGVYFMQYVCMSNYHNHGQSVPRCCI